MKKKLSFKSIAIIDHDLGNKEIKEFQAVKDPLVDSFYELLNLLRFSSFSFTTDTEEIYGLVDSSIC